VKNVLGNVGVSASAELSPRVIAAAAARNTVFMMSPEWLKRLEVTGIRVLSDLWATRYESDHTNLAAGRRCPAFAVFPSWFLRIEC
jgi:hypothetical protein